MITQIIKKLYIKITGGADIKKLKRNGLRIGDNCSIMGSVILDPSHCWHIEIGNNVTLAGRVHVLAHDSCLKKHLGVIRIGKVIIGDNVFIGAGSIILPDVTIGQNSIIGAGSVVAHDIPNDTVAAGNPAHVVSSLSSFIEKHKTQLKQLPLFPNEYTLGRRITQAMKDEMNSALTSSHGYVAAENYQKVSKLNDTHKVQ